MKNIKTIVSAPNWGQTHDLGNNKHFHFPSVFNNPRRSLRKKKKVLILFQEIK